MAKYKFKCLSCEKEQMCYGNLADMAPKCCNKNMEMQMPNLVSQQTTEVVDSYTNKSWVENQPKMIEERSTDYFWSVEVPRLVQSGIYALETMLENDWVYFDDKNEMQINTKPPNKR